MPWLYRRRKWSDWIAMGLSMAATALGLFCLFLILWTVAANGLSGIDLQVFTEPTPPPNAQGGGLANAIVGSLLMTCMGTALGAPIGLMAGTYMAEYGRYEKLTEIIRFINDILLSAPSIIVGLFIYGVIVAPMGGFSGFAGILALATIIIPIVLRTTENMLLLVPDQLREAAAGLGMPRYKIIGSVSYRAAKVGVVTGLLLGVARISGETAPLLFTSLSNQFWSLDIFSEIANLPVTINNFINAPDPNWRRLAWVAAFLITSMVLALNIAARLLLARSQSK